MTNLASGNLLAYAGLAGSEFPEPTRGRRPVISTMDGTRRHLEPDPGCGKRALVEDRVRVGGPG